MSRKRVNIFLFKIIFLRVGNFVCFVKDEKYYYFTLLFIALPNINLILMFHTSLIFITFII